MKPIILTSILFTSLIHAEVKLPSVFGDGMILQREMPVPIWGTADPDEKVTVSFAGQNVSGKADAKAIFKPVRELINKWS